MEQERMHHQHDAAYWVLPESKIGTTCNQDDGYEGGSSL
jgi:hypothetical protein